MSLSVPLTAYAIALAMLLIRPRTFLNRTLFTPIHAYGSFSVCRTALTYLSPVALNRVQRRTMLTTVFDPKQPACLADLISSSVQTLVSASSPPESNSSTPNGNAEHVNKESAVRLATLQVISAASQLVALVRPPEQTLMDAATGVSLSFPTEKLCIVRAWRSKVNVAINDWSGHVI